MIFFFKLVNSELFLPKLSGIDPHTNLGQGHVYLGQPTWLSGCPIKDHLWSKKTKRSLCSSY